MFGFDTGELIFLNLDEGRRRALMFLRQLIPLLVESGDAPGTFLLVRLALFLMRFSERGELLAVLLGGEGGLLLVFLRDRFDVHAMRQSELLDLRFMILPGGGEMREHLLFFGGGFFVFGLAVFQLLRVLLRQQFEALLVLGFDASELICLRLNERGGGLLVLLRQLISLFVEGGDALRAFTFNRLQFFLMSIGERRDLLAVLLGGESSLLLVFLRS